MIEGDVECGEVVFVVGLDVGDEGFWGYIGFFGCEYDWGVVGIVGVYELGFVVVYLLCVYLDVSLDVVD